MGCGCGQSGVQDILNARQEFLGLDPLAMLAADTGDNMARLKFIGPQQGSIPFGGPGRTPSGAVYWGGNNLTDLYKEVPMEDVQWLLNTGQWEVVVQRQAVDLQTPPVKIKLPTAKRKPGQDADPKSEQSTEPEPA